MTQVTWREPPKRRTGRRFEGEAREMRENPGKWLLLDCFLPDEGDHARSMANAIKIGRYSALRPAGAFETRTATEQDDSGNLKVNVYVRYTGDGGS